MSPAALAPARAGSRPAPAAGELRVALCPAGLQWLLQRRREAKAGAAARWDALAFCTTRAALARLWRAHGGGEAPALDALPERVPRRRRQGDAGPPR